MSIYKPKYFYFAKSCKLFGFSLIELMVCIAIAVILAVAAAPFLGHLPDNSRLTERQQKIAAQIQNARSEAIRTDKIVYVCSVMKNILLQADNCTAKTDNDWASGAMVYSDKNNTTTSTTGSYDAGEKISSAVFDRKVDISARLSPFDKQANSPIAQLAFLPTGRQKTGAEIDFQLINKKGDLCRGLIVYPSGMSSFCKKGDADCAHICN